MRRAARRSARSRTVDAVPAGNSETLDEEDEEAAAADICLDVGMGVQRPGLGFAFDSSGANPVASGAWPPPWRAHLPRGVQLVRAARDLHAAEGSGRLAAWIGIARTCASFVEFSSKVLKIFGGFRGSSGAPRGPRRPLEAPQRLPEVPRDFRFFVDFRRRRRRRRPSSIFSHSFDDSSSEAPRRSRPPGARPGRPGHSGTGP